MSALVTDIRRRISKDFGAPPLGIICRKCHCPELHVTRTRKGPGGKIYRWRMCGLCGETMVTTESAQTGTANQRA